jgi:hypothetical protein
MSPAAIQMDADQCLGVDTETNGTLGEPGQVIELETLSGFSLSVSRSARTFTYVSVVIHRARTDGSLAIFQETRCACLLRQNPHGHSQG